MEQVNAEIGLSMSRNRDISDQVHRISLATDLYVGLSLDMVNQGVNGSLTLDQLAAKSNSVNTLVRVLSGYVEGTADLQTVANFFGRSRCDFPATFLLAASSIGFRADVNDALNLCCSSNRLNSYLWDKFLWSRYGIDKIQLARNFMDCSNIVSYLDQKDFYFTPIVQGAIGHMCRITDIYLASRAMNKQANIHVIGSFGSPGSSLLTRLATKKELTVIYTDYSGILQEPIGYLAKFIAANFYCDWLSANQRRFVESTSCSYDYTKERQVFVMHLRTGLFRGNDHRLGDRIRSVDPLTYYCLDDFLHEKGFVGININADETTNYSGRSLTLHVRDAQSLDMQWRLLEKAAFVVGTGSGISHLTGLGSGRVIMTNCTTLLLSSILSSRHIFLLKNFLPDSRWWHLSPVSRLNMIVSSWEYRNGVATYGTITDNSPQQLLAACQEYLNISPRDSIESRSINHFTSLLGVSPMPDRFLSEDSFCMIGHLLGTD